MSNKIYALSRVEPKDIADIVFIAKQYAFNWEDILKEAREKDLWVEPLEVCRIIKGFPFESLERMKWITEVNMDEIKALVQRVHDDIFYGSRNSLSRETV